MKKQLFTPFMLPAGTGRRLRLLLGCGIAMLCAGNALAAGYELHNVTERISGTYASAAGDMVIGPSAVITVDGDWYITAANFYIHPSATISGTGTIHLMNPSTYGAPAAATNLDAGGVTIGCKISVENDKTISLGYIDPAAVYGSSGISDSHAAGSDDLVLANNLNFNNNNAHVILNSSNVVFTSAAAATITYADLNTAGFTADPAPPASPYLAYFVTNGATSGVVTKQGLANAASFTYPVGSSSATASPYDYTPATVTNTAASRNISVRVQNYTNSASAEGNAAKGVDRTWNVYSDAAGTATVALTHNAANNNAGNSTNGSSFDNTAAYISQQLSAGTWSWDSTVANGGTPASTHSGNFTLAASGSAATAYFTKASGVNGVSDVLSASPVVFLQGAMSGTTMKTTLRTNNLLPLTQPYGTLFSYAGKEKVAAIPANVTDWVLVELRDATTPSTILARRAAFVKNDGTVVDIDGTSPVGFSGVAAGNYIVSIRHRNHLGIRTPSSLKFALNGTATAYNFSTAQAQAYQNGAITTNAAMKDLGNGIFAMWGGNGANAGAGATTVRANGAPAVNDYSALLTKLNGGTSVPNQYDATDFNMDGTVRNNGAPAVNDYSFLLSVLGTNSIITQHL